MYVFFSHTNGNTKCHQGAKECPVNGVALENYSHFGLGLVAILVGVIADVVLNHIHLLEFCLEHQDVYY